MNSPLTKKLIREGLEPTSAPVTPSLYDAFYRAAMDTLEKGAPGLTNISCASLARSIALKCQHAVNKRAEAA